MEVGLEGDNLDDSERGERYHNRRTDEADNLGKVKRLTSFVVLYV